MPAAFFLGYLRAMLDEEQKRLDQQLKISAHTGWQIRNLLSGIMGGKEINYLDYLEPMGLLSKQEKNFIRVMRALQAHQAKDEAKQNIAKAEKIIELARKRGR